MEREVRTFVIMFLAVVPLLQRGVVLLIRGWDVEEFDVDGGSDGGGGRTEIASCNGGGGGGGMGVDTGAIEVEVFNCAIGGGVVLLPEPTTTYKF